MTEDKINQLSMLLKDKEHISVSVHIDNRSNVEGRAYDNVKAYVSGDKLIIEGFGQVMLTEASITEIDNETAKIVAKDEDNRDVIISILAR